MTNCYEDGTQVATQYSFMVLSIEDTALNERGLLALLEFRRQHGKTGRKQTANC